MKLRSILSVGMCISSFLVADHTYAQLASTSTKAPHSSTISYQGIVKQGQSPLPDGTYQFTIHLYTDADGAEPIWSDKLMATVTNGVFDLALGSNIPLPSAKELDKQLWVGVQLDNGAEMRPLAKLSAVPFAVNVADGAVTQAKMGTDYVGALSIDGEKITGIGTAVNLKGANGIALKYDETTNSVVLMPSSNGGKGKTPTWIGSNATGNNNDAGTPNGSEPTNTIGGGDSNVITMAGLYGTIGGGLGNNLSGAKAFIGGGHDNVASPDYTTIGGGEINHITDNASYSAIAGGYQNTIENTSGKSFIGSGNVNIITANSAYSAIGSGDQNHIENANWSFIGSGEANYVTGNHGIVGGGSNNQASGNTSSILGGLNNLASDPYATIGGGQANQAVNSYAAVGGGRSNLSESQYAAILGGQSNDITADADHSMIGGGQTNHIYDNASYSAIAGGYQNTIENTSGKSFIGSGNVNIITANSAYSAIAGGDQNHIENANWAFIGSGEVNYVTGNHGIVGGGSNNQASGNTSSLLGGANNLASDPYTTVGGGQSNQAVNSYATVTGGASNDAEEQYASIGGGYGNTVSAGGIDGTIPGGDQLEAVSYAQTVIGARNRTQGSVPWRYHGTSNLNDRIFIIGNGTDEVRSNAFEVSYNGHSIVYDKNGSGASRAAIRGATYQDNVIYGWGDIASNGAVNSDFGVASVVWSGAGTGTYTVTLNPVDPDGNPLTLSQGSVTATVVNHTCAFISVSQLNNNSFTVNITENKVVGGELECSPVDAAFDFKVTARP